MTHDIIEITHRIFTFDIKSAGERERESFFLKNDTSVREIKTNINIGN